jgi:glycyl-tRNA synthetase
MSDLTSQPSSSQPTTSGKPMDAIMALCKRRGFIYQASEIYGGINGFWDYGPLGAQLKKNLRDAWWEDMIMRPCWGRKGPNGREVTCVPVETCIIQHPKVWEASGHVAGFNDPMVDCKACKSRFRADQVWVLRWWKESEYQENNKEADKAWHEHMAMLNAARRNPTDTKLQDAAAESKRVFADMVQNLIRPYTKSVIAGSEAEATEVGKLSSSEERRFGRVVSVQPQPLTTYFNGLMSAHWTPPPLCPNPKCQSPQLTEPRQFNLMFKTYIGATATEDDKAYMRPETAQGVFVQAKNVWDTTRVRVPFGIGNTGRSFRNEVTPRNFTFRSREFEQAELEFFCHPDESHDWYKFWRDFRMEWWKAIGLAGDNLILREHDKDELSHYSVGTSDVEYRFPFTAPGFGELEGIAHRGNFDLTQHAKHSGAKMEYNDTERGEVLPNGSRRGERYIPHCIEPAAGLDRGALALICEGYTRDESRPSPEFMKFHPRVAPIKAAVFPLVNKDGMPEAAERLHTELNNRFWRLGAIEMDEKQSIGKRYARMDEAGCPYCFTIDGDTLKDQTVTMRDRDTGQQTRMAMDKVKGFLEEKLGV